MITKGKWTLEKTGDNTNDKVLIGHPNPTDFNVIRTIGRLFSCESDEQAEANGRHICLCVNSHDKLLEACKGLFKLIEDGELVRNTQNDDSPTWALEHLGFVVTLKDAKQVIVECEGE